MPGQRLPMHKIRDVLRLSAGGMSKRKIAASLGVSPTAAGECIRRARRVGLGWPLPADMADAALESRLYPPPATTAKDQRPQPDWVRVHGELRRPGVTLQLLWEEHRGTHPDGYGYSRFCELYRAWEGRLSATMRQTHVAGERLFVDYAGTTMEVIDGTTGEVLTAQLFVAALGASNYTYAEATWTQGLADWIGSHTRAVGFFGGAVDSQGGDQHQVVADVLAIDVDHPKVELRQVRGQPLRHAFRRQRHEPARSRRLRGSVPSNAYRQNQGRGLAHLLLAMGRADARIHVEHNAAGEGHA